MYICISFSDIGNLFIENIGNLFMILISLEKFKGKKKIQKNLIVFFLISSKIVIKHPVFLTFLKKNLS